MIYSPWNVILIRYSCSVCTKQSGKDLPWALKYAIRIIRFTHRSMMDYRPYHLQITLRRIDRNRSPSPCLSEVTLRRIDIVCSPQEWPEVRLSQLLQVVKATFIPRPHGILSRPNHGDYTLCHVLCWNDEMYKSVQVCSHFTNSQLIARSPRGTRRLHHVCEKHPDTWWSYMVIVHGVVSGADCHHDGSKGRWASPGRRLSSLGGLWTRCWDVGRRQEGCGEHRDIRKNR